MRPVGTASRAARQQPDDLHRRSDRHHGDGCAVPDPSRASSRNARERRRTISCRCSSNTDLDENGSLRKLNDAEIFSFVLLLSAAGTETVARLLGLGRFAPRRSIPEERAKLVDDPSLIPNAVEECLRYEAPSPVNGRWVTRRRPSSMGKLIPKGSKLLAAQRLGQPRRASLPGRRPRSTSRRRSTATSRSATAPTSASGAALARMEGHDRVPRDPRRATRRGRSTVDEHRDGAHVDGPRLRQAPRPPLERDQRASPSRRRQRRLIPAATST